MATASDGTFASGATSVSQEAQLLLNNFWSNTLDEIKNLQPSEFKMQELPLARIKKIMKLDEDVKMISAEAPALFARAAEIFVHELTLRAWVHTEDNKRRTLQRNDIAMAISKYDQFDFLIDIVPRDELKPTKRPEENVQRTSMVPDQVQYYFQLAQQHQAALQQQTTSQPQQIQGQVVQPLQVQLPTSQGQGVQTITIQQPEGGQPQIIQLQQLQQPQVSLAQAQVPQPQVLQASQVAPGVTQMAGAGGAQVTTVSSQAQQQQPQTQVYTQVVTPSGEIQNIPIQLTPAQIQNITLQMQGKQPGQPIVIQTQPQAEGDAQGNDPTQPLFQVPINIGGQQVYVQQASGDGDTGEEA